MLILCHELVIAMSLVIIDAMTSFDLSWCDVIGLYVLIPCRRCLMIFNAMTSFDVMTS